jgi:transposase
MVLGDFLRTHVKVKVQRKVVGRYVTVDREAVGEVSSAVISLIYGFRPLRLHVIELVLVYGLMI